MSTQPPIGAAPTSASNQGAPNQGAPNQGANQGASHGASGTAAPPAAPASLEKSLARLDRLADYAFALAARAGDAAEAEAARNPISPAFRHALDSFVKIARCARLTELLIQTLLSEGPQARATPASPSAPQDAASLPHQTAGEILDDTPDDVESPHRASARDRDDPDRESTDRDALRRLLARHTPDEIATRFEITLARLAPPCAEQDNAAPWPAPLWSGPRSTCHAAGHHARASAARAPPR